MSYPLYFEPDPQIPDSDVLGYGDLVYDDGTRTYLSNDPERASQFEVKPIQNAPPPEQVPTPDFMQQQAPPLMGADGKQYTTDLLDPENPIKPVTDPMSGQVMPQQDPAGAADLGDLVRGAGNALEIPPMQQFGQQQPGAPAPAPQAPQGPQAPQPMQGADGRMYTTDLFDPQNPIKPVEQGGLQPYQREGALPPDVAARQQSETGAMNQQTLDINKQAIGEQGRIMSEATLKAMGENDAAKHKAEEDIREQQAKMDRLQKERQQVNDMALDKSLIGAAGVGGGLLAVIGSAMLGGIGSDAGLRMMDKMIDRHVNEQVARKNTQLGMLADQIGSTQQAIAIGKAQLYKAVGDHAELLVQKTKNDVYEAQAPAILQNIRQKQLEYSQKWEQDSLGKVTERVPVVKPPDAKSLQKYGELRRERDAATEVVQRMEQQIGLIWQPGKGGQPGRYVNGEEKIKGGIEGVGAVEQWVPDFVYSTLGQKDGYQVRGAKQAIAYAAVRQMQPTGIITDIDRKVGEMSATLDTEAGLVQTLERLRNGEESMSMNDAAQYTPQVVAEYERQYRSSGGQQPGNPGAARPAGLQDLQGEQQRRRQPQPSTEPVERGPGNLPPPTPEEFQGSIRGFAESAGLNPEAVARVIQHESGGKPGVTNQQTGKHAGLIQFSRETWDGLAKEAGTPDLSWEEMRNMSAEEQLPYVMMYFNRLGLGPDNDPGDYAMAAFMPAYWNKPDSFVLGAKGSGEKIGGLSMAKVWQQNPGLRNGDTITVGDVRRSVL